MMKMGENRKRSRGRCKIAMEKIEDKGKKFVTFTKRRQGIFKKASELCVLTGAEIAIVTFSEAGKAFTFGHPSADAVIGRYLRSSSSSSGLSASSSLASSTSYSDHLGSNSGYCGDGYGDVSGAIGFSGGGDDDFWWDRPIEDLGLNELEDYLVALQGLRDNVVKRMDEKQGLMEEECCDGDIFMLTDDHGSPLPYYIF